MEETEGLSSSWNVLPWYWVKSKEKCYETFNHKKDFIDAINWGSNPRLILTDNLLTNSKNITPFVGWNKQTERARRETHFYGNE